MKYIAQYSLSHTHTHTHVAQCVLKEQKRGLLDRRRHRIKFVVGRTGYARPTCQIDMQY